jgi:hypothetical protein
MAKSVLQNQRSKISAPNQCAKIQVRKCKIKCRVPVKVLGGNAIGFCMTPSKVVLCKEIGDDFVATSGIQL